MATDTFTTDVTVLADQVRDQFLATVKQSNELALNAVNTWSKAVSALPIPELPEVPGAPKAADLTTATTYSFDLAIELLNIQRDFALQVVNAMTPTATA